MPHYLKCSVWNDVNSDDTIADSDNSDGRIHCPPAVLPIERNYVVGDTVIGIHSAPPGWSRVAMIMRRYVRIRVKHRPEQKADGIDAEEDDNRTKLAEVRVSQPAADDSRDVGHTVQHEDYRRSVVGGPRHRVRVEKHEHVADESVERRPFQGLRHQDQDERSPCLPQRASRLRGRPLVGRRSGTSRRLARRICRRP